MVPAQKRPRLSHLPSFMRLTGWSCSTAATSRVLPVSGSIWRKPSTTAAISCPDSVGTTAPTSRPTSSVSTRPLPGSNQSSRRPVMSTQSSRCWSGSQTGPSPIWLAVEATTSTSPAFTTISWRRVRSGARRAHHRDTYGLWM